MSSTSSAPDQTYTPLSGIDWGTALSASGQTSTGTPIYQIGYYIVSAAGSATLAGGSDEDGTYSPGTVLTGTDLNAYQTGQIAAALATISAVCNVTFRALDETTRANASLNFIVSPEVSGLGVAAPPGTPLAGTVALSVNQGTTASGAQAPIGTAPGSNLDAGGYGFVSLIHELGHALGLAHPHDDGGTSTIFPGVTGAFGSLGTYDLNQGVYTMMSYNDGWASAPVPVDLSTIQNWGNEATPMALDIAVLQAKYGANMSANPGNDTYILPDQNISGTSWRSIWDPNGTNTIAYFGAGSAVIDLRPATLQFAPGGGGYLSYVAGTYGGFTIAAGSKINTAIGGTGNDTFQANDAGDLIITGTTGANTVMGGAGSDTVLSRGNDLLLSGRGTSELFLGSGKDTVVVGGSATLAGGGGQDTVLADGTGNNLAFAANTKLVFVGGPGASTVFGADGSTTVFGGAGALVAAGGTQAANVLSGGTGGATLFGAVSGDQLFATGTAGNFLVAGVGDETLSGQGASGALQILAGTGSDMIVLGSGSNTVDAGTGRASIVAGGGNNTVAFFNGRAGGSDTLTGFKQGSDHVQLAGYAAGAASAALSAAVVAGGSTIVTLSDNTAITFAGLTNLPLATFV